MSLPWNILRWSTTRYNLLVVHHHFWFLHHLFVGRCSTRGSIVPGLENFYFVFWFKDLRDHFCQACVAWQFFHVFKVLDVEGSCSLQLIGLSYPHVAHTFWNVIMMIFFDRIGELHRDSCRILECRLNAE